MKRLHFLTSFTSVLFHSIMNIYYFHTSKEVKIKKNKFFSDLEICSDHGNANYFIICTGLYY